MSEKVMERLAEWVRTGPGRRWFEQVDRETSAREDAVAERRVLIERIAEARRQRRENLPRFVAEVDEKVAVLAVAKTAYEKARRERYEVGIAAERFADRLREDVRRAEGRLRVTADPRLLEVRDVLLDAAHNWHHAANAKACFETRGEFMDAHKVMLNRDELDAMRSRIDRALARVEALLLVAEPREDEILAAVLEGEAASEPVLGVVRRYFA